MLRDRAPPEAEEARQRAQVVGHERDVGGLERGVAARRAHRDADVGGGERGRVVDAVAHHRHGAVRAPAARAPRRPCRSGSRRARTSVTPARSATAAAVRSLSPVSITTCSMPARAQAARRSRAASGPHVVGDARSADGRVALASSTSTVSPALLQRRDRVPRRRRAARRSRRANAALPTAYASRRRAPVTPLPGDVAILRQRRQRRRRARVLGARDGAPASGCVEPASSVAASAEDLVGAACRPAATTSATSGRPQRERAGLVERHDAHAAARSRGTRRPSRARRRAWRG